MDGWDTYWCPKCKSWRWIGYIIPGAPVRKTPQIEYLAPLEKQSMVYMNKVMDKYKEDIEEILNGQVVTYSWDNYDQDFLLNLIPSLKEKYEK